MPIKVVIQLNIADNTKVTINANVEGHQSKDGNAVSMNFREAKFEELKADAVVNGSSTFYKMLPHIESFNNFSANGEIRRPLFAPIDGVEGSHFLYLSYNLSRRG